MAQPVASREQPKRLALVGGELARRQRHWMPVSVSRGGCSIQFGRASAPMMPHRVQTKGRAPFSR